MKRIIFSLFIIFFFISCSTAYKSITALMPDLTQCKNGVYRGFYDLSGTPVKATLDVTIQDNKIIDISIVKHISSPIGKKAEVIIENIISRQSLDVDVISGATASSKAIIKAIENALQ